jgi:hypothetical protein
VSHKKQQTVPAGEDPQGSPQEKTSPEETAKPDAVPPRKDGKGKASDEAQTAPRVEDFGEFLKHSGGKDLAVISRTVRENLAAFREFMERLNVRLNASSSTGPTDADRATKAQVEEIRAYLEKEGLLGKRPPPKEKKGVLNFSNTLRAEKPTIAWGDILDDVEEGTMQFDTGALAVASTGIFDPEDAIDRIGENEIHLPSDFSTTMVSWARLTGTVAEANGLTIRPSAVSTIAAAGLICQGAYVGTPGDRRAAAGRGKAASSSWYNAFRSINSWIAFFLRPIDFRKRNFKPTAAEAMVLMMLIREKIKTETNEEFCREEIQGLRFSPHCRKTVADQCTALFAGEQGKAVGNAIFLALDRLTRRYIRRMIAMPIKDPRYWRDLFDVCKADISLMVARLARSQPIPARKKEVDNRGRVTYAEYTKNRKVLPWVTINREVMLPIEIAFAQAVNACCGRLVTLITDIVEFEGECNPANRFSTVESCVSGFFSLTDGINAMIKHRRSEIRQNVLAARPRGTAGKMTSTEWEAARQRVMALERPHPLIATGLERPESDEEEELILRVATATQMEQRIRPIMERIIEDVNRAPYDHVRMAEHELDRRMPASVESEDSEEVRSTAI